MAYVIETTELYDAWFAEQTSKRQAQIEKRLLNVKEHEHFGHVRKLDSQLAEIKFNDGTRIYFAVKFEPTKTVILLLGGNKNGQDKDIKKAKSLLD